jgi:hypothetical protein
MWAKARHHGERGLSIAVVIKTAYLRVYQPLETFSPVERQAWERADPASSPAEERAAKQWLLSNHLGEWDVPEQAGGAFVRHLGDVTLVCPWRTRLRMLAGLLAFRDSVPEEIAEMFVPADAARYAAHELAELGDRRPDIRSHIIHSNWHVPLRWFVAFDETERILTEDARGIRIRYETSLGSARARLERAIEVLEEVWIDDEITDMVRNLGEWLADFPGEGLLELDYGSVAGSFSGEELAEDRSAGEIWECLESLAAGDLVASGRLFNSLTERWAGARSFEAIN